MNNPDSNNLSQKYTVVSNLAQQILRLEAMSGRNGWTKIEEKEWLALVTNFLKIIQEDKDQRKSLRIPASQSFLVMKGTFAASSKLKDLSHRGLSFYCEPTNIQVKDMIWIEMRKTSAAPHPIRLRVRVKWIKVLSENKWLVGVQFASFEPEVVTSDTVSKQSFSTYVYYPCYVWYLMSLSIVGIS